MRRRMEDHLKAFEQAVYDLGALDLSMDIAEKADANHKVNLAKQRLTAAIELLERSEKRNRTRKAGPQIDCGNTGGQADRPRDGRPG